MPAGLQMWDGAGNLVHDTNLRIMRVHAYMTAGSSGGSAVVPELSEGDPIYLFITNSLGDLPTVSFSGTTVSWSGGSAGGTLVVGTY